jgi:iron complex outermembrane receptor protein
VKRAAWLGAGICWAVAGGAAHAQEAEQGTPLGVIEVIGSASEGLPPGADVLDIDTIREQARRNVAEALDLLPGVTRQNMGQRRDTLINVRGFDSRQVTLYIDGVPVYVPYDGNLDLARFDVEDLSRIVVTKGLTSVLYGPNALGGSINLVSRRPRTALEGRAYAGFDADRSGVPTYRAGGRIATDQGAWYAQASAFWQDSDGFELPSDYPRSANQPGGRRANSAQRDLDLAFKIGWTPNATDEYALNVYHVDATKQTPPYDGHAPGVAARFWRWPQWDKDDVYFISRQRLSDTADLNLRVYYDTFRNELRSYDDARYTTQQRPYAFTSLYDDHTYGVSATFEQRWSERQITRFALHGKQDFHREMDKVGSPWEHFKDRTWSAGLEHEWRPDAAWTITPGVSWNLLQAQRADNLGVGNAIVPFPVGSDVAFNGQLVVARQLSDDLQLYAGASRKTRFPTLKDRYSYRLGSAIPNPTLEPENSNTLEIGAKGRAGALGYTVAVFDSHLQKAMQSEALAPEACTSPPCSQLRNVGRARNRGVELSGDLALGEAWSIGANYTYLQRENLSQPDLRPVDTPRQKLFATLGYRFADGWKATLSSDTESKRYSSSDGARVAGGFTVVDAMLRGPFASLDLSFGVRNAFDRRYSYQEGFPEAGRTWFVEAGKSF